VPSNGQTARKETVAKGEWSDDGNTLSGEWVWPGGGYNETMTRIEP
jgi:hypothetical protein